MSEANRRTFLSWLSRSGLALAAIGAGRTAAAADQPSVLVFTNATLIDGTGADPRHGTTIVVVGERIAAVGPHGMPPPAGVRVVDLRGRYVLPGLWDMHTHTPDLERIFLPLYVANGITGVREMWGFPFLHPMRARIDTGELMGPRMVLASNIIDGPDSIVAPESLQVRTPAEAREAVRQAKRDGADFLKVFSFLTDDTLTAIVDEAKRLGLSFAGHVPDRVPVLRASALGMRTQEHLFGLYLEASSDRGRFRRIIETTPVDATNPTAWFFMVRDLERQALGSYDPRRAAQVFATLRRNRTIMSPTLIVARYFSFPPETFRGDPRTKYLPDWVTQSWEQALGPPWTPEQIARGRENWAGSLRLVDGLTGAGVPVIPGTDCGIRFPYSFAGFSLHDELALQVEAGRTPMQVIQGATRDAARTVGLGDVTGTVTPGKSADLLIVEGNPLADIRNTQRIHAILNRGRLITRAERERMLAEVEAEAKRTPPPTTQLAACCTLAHN